MEKKQNWCYGLVEDEPEYIGRMPIRMDIEVLPADEPRSLKLGWTVKRNYWSCYC